MNRVSVLVFISLFLTMTSTLTPQESSLKALLRDQLQINRRLNQLLQSNATTVFSLKFLNMPFKELGFIVNNTGISNKLNKTLQSVADTPSSGLTSTEEPNMKMHESRMLTNLFNPGDMNLYIRDKNLLQLQSASETFITHSKQHSILQNSVIKKSYGPRNMLHPSEIANKTQIKVHNDGLPLPKLSGVSSVTTEMLNSKWYNPYFEKILQNFTDDPMHKYSGFQRNTYATNRDLVQHPKHLGTKEYTANNKQMELPNSSSPPVHFFEMPLPRKSSIFQNYTREPKTNEASTIVLQGRIISVPISLTDIRNSGGVLNSKLILPTENRLHSHVNSPAKLAWSIGELFASTKYPQWSTGMKQNISQDNQKTSNLQNNEPSETVNNEPMVTVLASDHYSEPNDINSRTTNSITGNRHQYADRSDRNNLPENQMRQTNNHLTTTVQTKENEILLQYPMEKQGTNKKTKRKVTKMPPADTEYEEPEVESV